MKYVPTELLGVFLDTKERRKIGRLAFDQRRILFEYDPAFLASGIQVSPFHLGLRPGVTAGDPHVFDGLFGVFNDSLPDGWGRLLLDRAVEKQGLSRHQLTPLDRLAHVGRHGMGALSYEPDHSDQEEKATVLHLDRIAHEAANVLAGEQGAVIEKLLKLNGASSGARPKVVAQVSDDKKHVIHGHGALPSGYAHWIIKFPAQVDAADIGPIEYAYSRMARDAGVMMPDTFLFRGRKKKKGYFGIRRFDRIGDQRVHMHSLSGLVHADHRAASLDYDALLTATLILTKDAREVETAFALACFNVLAHNRDDHSKNVSFLMDEGGRWTLAPAYDLTFSSGLGGEQTMTVMGEGRAPGRSNLRALAQKHGIKHSEDTIARVQTAVSRWPKYADEAGVTKASAKLVGTAMRAIAQRDITVPVKTKTKRGTKDKATPASSAKRKTSPKQKANKAKVKVKVKVKVKG